MRTRRMAAVWCCILFSCSAALRAQEPRLRGPVGALSIGSPTDGALVGGVALREQAELRLRWPEGPRWALPELVSMLGRAARRVDRRYPGSILLVGDLSRREGGALVGHVSHASGRDADVGFYYADARGRAVRTERLLPVRAAGGEHRAGSLRFDEARNWALVESFLTDPDVVVQRIFVADGLKRGLLGYARRHGAEAALLERAEAAMKQPGAGAPHDDHFHVRIACPREQSRVCISEPIPLARPSHERTAALGPNER